MTRLSIQIPDDLKTALDARAADAGFTSTEAYVESLVRSEVEGIDYGTPEHLKVRSREDLERLVQEGLESPAHEMTPADWDEMRTRLIARHRQPKVG